MAKGKTFYRATVSTMGLHPGDVVQLEDSPRIQGLVEVGYLEKVKVSDVEGSEVVELEPPPQ